MRYRRTCIRACKSGEAPGMACKEVEGMVGGKKRMRYWMACMRACMWAVARGKGLGGLWGFRL